jgi:hypothetical protein
MTTLEWGADVENELIEGTPVSDLRDWARGLLPLTAATELLIRGGWAQTWRPWVLERDGGGWWIDFEAIADHIGALSGGERRFLLLAKSLGAYGELVGLEDTISGLDHDKVNLVLAALAAAAGADHLHPWPQ